MSQQDEEPAATTRDLVPLVRAKVEAGMSIKDAVEELAAIYPFSAAAITKAYQRDGKSEAKSHGNCALSEDQEKMIVAVAISYSQQNIAITYDDVMDLIEKLFGVTVSRTWVINFLSRHSKLLSRRRVKLLADKRMDEDTLSDVEFFVSSLQEFFETHHVPPECIINCDETRVAYNQGGPSAIRIESTAKSKANSLGTRQDTLATLLVFISAAGTTELSIYIFRNSFEDAEEKDATFVLYEHDKILRGDWPRFYAFTETGYINSKIWADAMTIFEDHWTARNPGRDCLLLFDQLGVHSQVEVVARAMEKGIYHYFLPKNTSHFTQPLDDSPFASFKNALARIHSADVHAAVLHGEERGRRLVTASYQAESEGFTPDNIKHAFKEVGLYPFNPELIMERARANLLGDFDNDLPKEMDALVKAVNILTNKNKPKPITKLTAPVKKDTICSGHSLIVSSKKKAEMEEAKRLEVEARKASKAAKVSPNLL
jgi:hypothetical protein